MKHFRVFGSKAFAYIFEEKWFKLDLRTEQGIFVGFVLGCKENRFFEPKIQTIRIFNVVYIDEKNSKPQKKLTLLNSH